jgi:hypothetical protein
MCGKAPGRKDLLDISRSSSIVTAHQNIRRVLMKRIIIALAIVFLFVSVAMAAGPKTYQVTGPVLEIKDNIIVVQKGKDKWEVARDKDTKVKGDLKVGSKVTIEYTMTAATVDVKDAGKKAAEPKKTEPKKEAPAKK